MTIVPEKVDDDTNIVTKVQLVVDHTFVREV
jgi:hypothetical protein